MDFATLKARARADCFPAGEQENLLTVHDGYFQGALADLCKSVDCLKMNHLSVHPSCSTYFNCGMTVLPAPRGEILSVYTIGKSNCATSPAKEEWCSKVYYEQVDYCHIEKFVHIRQRTTSQNAVVAASIFSGIFGNRRRKTSYPAPTDVGLTSLPALPPGFHYPQASTDAGFRSRGGVYAIYRGRIYIAPWIESDEALVIEWNGQKSFWNDADGVEDSIKFYQAVVAYVSWQHYLYFEENPEKRDAFETQYFNLRRELIHDCREQNRIRDCVEAGGRGDSARGMGSADSVTGQPTPSPSSLFWNEFLSGTVNCPSGSTSNTVAWTAPANTVSSPNSVADANATATNQAQALALERCMSAPPGDGGDGDPLTGNCWHNGIWGWCNEAQPDYIASCPGQSGDIPAAEGTSVKVSIPAGQFFSTVNPGGLDIANAAALDNAKALAESQLVCKFWNAPQQSTAVCPTAHANTNTATVGAKQFSFTNPVGEFNPVQDQTNADNLAKAQAEADAAAGLVGCSNTVTVHSVLTQVHLSGQFPQGACILPGYYNFTITILFNAHSLIVENNPTAIANGQLTVNGKSQSDANSQAMTKYLALQQWYWNTCRKSYGTGGGMNIH
jgi:hypothetical protein